MLLLLLGKLLFPGNDALGYLMIPLLPFIALAFGLHLLLVVATHSNLQTHILGVYSLHLVEGEEEYYRLLPLQSPLLLQLPPSHRQRLT